MLKCRPLSPTDLALKYGGLGRLDLLIRTDHPIVQQLLYPGACQGWGYGGIRGEALVAGLWLEGQRSVQSCSGGRVVCPSALRLCLCVIIRVQVVCHLSLSTQMTLLICDRYTL